MLREDGMYNSQFEASSTMTVDPEPVHKRVLDEVVLAGILCNDEHSGRQVE